MKQLNRANQSQNTGTFGNINERIAGAKIEFEEISKDSSSEGIRIVINKQMTKKWEIETGLERDAQSCGNGRITMRFRIPNWPT